MRRLRGRSRARSLVLSCRHQAHAAFGATPLLGLAYLGMHGARVGGHCWFRAVLGRGGGMTRMTRRASALRRGRGGRGFGERIAGQAGGGRRRGRLLGLGRKRRRGRGRGRGGAGHRKSRDHRERSSELLVVLHNYLSSQAIPFGFPPTEISEARVREATLMTSNLPPSSSVTKARCPLGSNTMPWGLVPAASSVILA